MFSTVRRLSKSRTSFRKGLSVRLVHVDTLLVPEAYPILPLEEARSGKYELTRSKFEIVMEKVDKLEEEMQNLQDTLLYCESVRLLEKTLLPGFLPYHEHIRTYMYISKLHLSQFYREVQKGSDPELEKAWDNFQAYWKMEVGEEYDWKWASFLKDLKTARLPFTHPHWRKSDAALAFEKRVTSPWKREKFAKLLSLCPDTYPEEE